MARIFSECVILRSPETGEPVVFLPGSPVPGWAELLVTNPAATVGIPDEITTDADTTENEEKDQAVESAKAQILKVEKILDARAEAQTQLDTERTLSITTRPYGNATKNEWADYATTFGVVIPDGATKNEIIALVDALPAAE